MSIKQVTVFGGSGFVGRAIVRALAQEGFQVRVACRRIELAERIKTAGEVGQITIMRTNLRAPASVAAAIAGSQAVVNASGIAFQRGRQKYHSVHVEGARTIAEAARSAGVQRLAFERRAPGRMAELEATALRLGSISDARGRADAALLPSSSASPP